MTLLQRLEAVTQVRLCHLCYYPDTNCRCSGIHLLTPLTSWSQITERTPVYRMTASSCGVTTLSTSFGGMSRLVPPPPGIPIGDMSPWETPIPQQSVTTPSYRPPIGRGKWLKATLSMRALVPQVPQIAPAIPQLPPLPQGQPATHTSRWYSCRLGLQDQESLLTSLPPSLLSLAVGTLMYAGDRLVEAEIMTVSLPATPGEDGRVDAPLGHLIISLHPPPLETPRHSLTALRGLPLETL